MHRLTPVWIAVVVASFTAAVAPAGASAGRQCEDVGSETVLRSDKVWVYRTDTRRPGYRACFVPTGLTTRLSRVAGRKQVDAIAGRFLAYRFTDFYESSQGGGFFTAVIVLDVRSGRRVIEASAFEGQFEENDPPSVSPIRLNADGSVAWAARDADDRTRSWMVNVASPSDDPEALEVLDTSPLIDPDSVALVPGFVYWTRDGAPQGRRL